MEVFAISGSKNGTEGPEQKGPIPGALPISGVGGALETKFRFGFRKPMGSDADSGQGPVQAINGGCLKRDRLVSCSRSVGSSERPQLS
jgi:hypothetical protein